MRTRSLLCRTVGHAAFAAVFAASVGAALAQDLGDVRRCAYCVGALRHTTGAIARLGAPADAQKQMQNLAVNAAVVRAAIGRDGIDAVVTREMIAAGQNDAAACWDQINICLLGARTDLDACMRPVEQACARVSGCSR